MTRQLTELIFPEHKCELRLTHNTHTVSYQTVSQLIAQQFEHYDDERWVSPEQKAKAIETNELWTLHWYPSTPIGFYVLHAADLGELLRRAIEV